MAEGSDRDMKLHELELALSSKHHHPYCRVPAAVQGTQPMTAVGKPGLCWLIVCSQSFVPTVVQISGNSWKQWVPTRQLVSKLPCLLHCDLLEMGQLLLLIRYPRLQPLRIAAYCK